MSIYIAEQKFCVYLTIYSGNKLPPFYIGSTNIVKIKNGYRGSPRSKRFGKIFHQELKENPHLFRTIILYTFYSRKNATYNERLLQKQFNVVKSDKFINMAIANHNGMFGMDNSGEKHNLFNIGHSEEGRKNISKGWETRKDKEEMKDRLRKMQKGVKTLEETKKKQSISSFGKPKSKEHKENMRKPKRKCCCCICKRELSVNRLNMHKC